MEIDRTLRTRLSKYLPSSLLEQIPEMEAISQATQRLSSLHKALSSFLPGYISKRDDLIHDSGSLTPGVFMFADVSGFTALSEQLMQQVGTEGIEILTEVINDYFATMLEILAKSEGELLKFAGDALLTFFPTTRGKDEAHKAINTGLRMQRAMQEKFQPIQTESLCNKFGTEHQLQLSMSIGISRGKLFEGLVGNIAQRDHIIMGRLPGMAMAAEEMGTRDDVIVDADLHEAYSAQFDMVEVADGFYRVLDNFGDRLGDYEFSLLNRRRSKSSFLFSFNEKDLLEDLEKELERVENISRFVSKNIVHKMAAQGDHVIQSENRLTTVIFVHFTGFAELLEQWGESHVPEVTSLLSRYYSTIHQVVDSYGGVLTRSDPYQLGSKLLITFGAPVAHADDPDRALAAALEMNQRLEQLNQRLREQLPITMDYPFIRQRIGITHGDAYAGEVGWRQRREYTVMGDQVNLAARLMSSAEFGQILISGRVWEQVQGNFETEALPPFQVKGKQGLIHAYAVKGARRDAKPVLSDIPFVGHDVLLLTINTLLQEVSAGGGSHVFGLAGEPGVGLSRFAKQVLLDAESQGYRSAWTNSRSQGGRKDSLMKLITQLFDIDQLDPLEAESRIREQLQALGLKDLYSVFEDLIFSTRIEEAQPRGRRRNSQIRQELFDKLSGADTLAMKKDDLSQFRKRMMSALDEKRSTADSYLWKPLQMKISLSEALAKFLAAYSQEAPLLLVLDDAHKENKRALQVLHGIVDRLREMPEARVLLLLTYDQAQMSRVNLEMIDTQATLTDLPEDEAYMLASAILGGAELGPRLSQFIWDSSKGRVFFIESLLQTLMEGDYLEEDDGRIEVRRDSAQALPDDVRGLIISRVDRLPTEQRSLLRAAAVLGDRFSIEELHYISEEEDINTLEKIVSSLLEAEFLEDAEPGYIRFRRGVVQRAVYEELPRRQRQIAHTKMAEFYSRLTEDIEQNVAVKVYHLMRCGMPLLAMSVATKAAQQAEDKLDRERALEFYNLALDIVPSDPDVQAKIAALQQESSL